MLHLVNYQLDIDKDKITALADGELMFRAVRSRKKITSDSSETLYRGENFFAKVSFCQSQEKKERREKEEKERSRRKLERKLGKTGTGER